MLLHLQTTKHVEEQGQGVATYRRQTFSIAAAEKLSLDNFNQAESHMGKAIEGAGNNNNNGRDDTIDNTKISFNHRIGGGSQHTLVKKLTSARDLLQTTMQHQLRDTSRRR